MPLRLCCSYFHFIHFIHLYHDGDGKRNMFHTMEKFFFTCCDLINTRSRDSVDMCLINVFKRNCRKKKSNFPESSGETCNFLRLCLDQSWSNFWSFSLFFFPRQSIGWTRVGRGFVSKCSPSPCPPGSSQDAINGAARYLALGETAGSEMRSPMLVFALFYEFVLVLMWWAQSWTISVIFSSPFFSDAKTKSH